MKINKISSTLCFLFFIFLLPAYCFCQTKQQYIIGLVTNANNQPLSNAIIQVVQNDSLQLIKGFTYTDETGKFRIEIFSSYFQKKFQLKVSLLGYQSQYIVLDSTSLIHEQLFVLSKLDKNLPDIFVKANIPISQKGDTTSFRVASFTKGNESNISDLIKRLPGFSINELGTIMYNGKMIDAVLLEGDDLFGSNYRNLVNNGSISGIEELEVIENYNNTRNLENTVLNGKQTVINLKYTGIGLRNFGQVSIGFAPFSNLQDHRLNITTLTKYIKAVTLGNYNNVGFLSQQLFGLKSDNELPENKNIEYPQTFQFVASPIQFENVEPININRARIFQNTSSLISTNLFVKPTKKIILTNTYAFLKDQFSQNYNSQYTFTGDLIPVVLIENNNILKRNRFFYTEGAITANWTDKNQTRLDYFYSKGIGNHQTVGKFQFQDLKQDLHNRNNQFSLLLTHVIKIKENSIFNVKYHYYTGYSNSNFSFTSPLEDSTLFIKQTDKLIFQSIAYNQRKHVISANWFKKIAQTSLSIKFNSSLTEITPVTLATVTRENGDIDFFPTPFFLNQNIVNKDSELEFILSRKINKKVRFNLTSSLKKVDYSILVDNFKNNLNQLFLLPNFSLTFDATKKSRISFNALINANKPAIEHLNSAKIFLRNNTITQGISELNLNTGYSLALQYYFSDLINKKVSFYTSLNFSNLPNLYFTNFQARNLYIFNQIVLANNRNQNMNLNIGIDKNLVQLKSWFTIRANYFKGNFYSSTQGLETVSDIDNIRTEVKYRTNWRKWLNISTSFMYVYNGQAARISSIQINKFSSQDFLTNMTIELKLSKKLFIDLQHDYLVNKSFNIQPQSIHFWDAKIRVNWNSRLYSSLTLRNILNTNAFVTNNTSLIQNTVRNFSLTPFFALFSLGVKF